MLDDSPGKERIVLLLDSVRNVRNLLGNSDVSDALNTMPFWALVRRCGATSGFILLRRPRLLNLRLKRQGRQRGGRHRGRRTRECLTLSGAKSAPEGDYRALAHGRDLSLG